MVKDEALKLISEYCTLAIERGLTDPAIVELDTRWPKDGSEKKAMRWLGFIQGALFALGVVSLEDIKRHSKLRSVR